MAAQLPQLTLDSAADADIGVLPSPPPDVVTQSPRTPLAAAAKHVAKDLVFHDKLGPLPTLMDLMPQPPARTVESTFGRVVGDQEDDAAAEEKEAPPRAVLPERNARGTEHRAAARDGHGDLVAAAAAVDDADSDDPDFSADDDDKDDDDKGAEDDEEEEEVDEDEEEASADGSASEADPDATEDDDHEDAEPVEEKTRASAPRVRRPKVTTRATHEKIMEVNGIRPGNWPGFKAGAVCVMDLKGVTHSVVRVIDATACEHKRNSPQFKEGRVELSNFVHLRVPLTTAVPPNPQVQLDQAPQYLTYFCEFSGKFNPIGPGPTAALLRQRWDRDQFSMPCRKVLFGEDMAPKSWDQACLRAAALCNRYGTAHSPILPECLFSRTNVWNKLLQQAWTQHRAGPAAGSSSADAARQTALELERMHAASIHGLDKAVRTQLLGEPPKKAKKRGGGSSGSKAIGAIAKAVSFAGKATQAAKEQAAAGSNSPAAKKARPAPSGSAPLAVGPPSSLAPASKKPAAGGISLANGHGLGLKHKKPAPALAEPPAKKAKPTAPAPAVAAAAAEPEYLPTDKVAAALAQLQQPDSGEEEPEAEEDEQEKALRLQLEALREKKKRAAEEAARKKKEAELEAARKAEEERKAAELEAARQAAEQERQQKAAAEQERKAAEEERKQKKAAAELERLKAQEAKEAERKAAEEERKQQPPPLAHKRKPTEAALVTDGCECRCCTHHDSLLQLRLFAKALKVAWAVTPCTCKCCELAHKIDVPLLAFGQMMRANQVVPDELELLRNFESTLTERKRRPEA